MGNRSDTATADAIDLTLVIACYNESRHLETSVDEVIATLDRTRWSYELIFIDDCSRDDTRAVIERIVTQHPHHRLRTAHHQPTAVVAKR